MAVKVSWGEKLEGEELKDRDQRWEDACNEMEAQVRRRLGRLGKGAEFRHVHPICLGCPEYPSECPWCKVDAAMSRHFEEPGLEVVIRTTREALDGSS